VVGSSRRRAAIAACVCGVLGTTALAGQQRYRNTASVCIRLTTTDHISGVAMKTLQDEASSIWRRHGIVLTWSQPVPESCTTVVPMIFDDDQFVKQGGRTRDSALALTVFLGRSQTIYISASRAFQMLSNLSQPTLNLETSGGRDLRGGTLLGRIVAHELGHVLLTTLAHSETGLMRPVFGLRDVLSGDDRTTALSAVNENRLAMRFSLVPLDRGPSVLAQGRLPK
jgi:hypothetical protein